MASPMTSAWHPQMQSLFQHPHEHPDSLSLNAPSIPHSLHYHRATVQSPLPSSPPPPLPPQPSPPPSPSPPVPPFVQPPVTNSAPPSVLPLPATSLKSSRDAVIFVAVVERCPTSDTLRIFGQSSCRCPNPSSNPTSHPLRISHLIAPNHPPDHPLLEASKASILRVPSLVFPSDLVLPEFAPHSELRYSTHNPTRHSEPHNPVPSVPTPPRPISHPVSPSAFTHNVIDSLYPNEQSLFPPPQHTARTIQLTSHIDTARTLPLSSMEIFNALSVKKESSPNVPSPSKSSSPRVARDPDLRLSGPIVPPRRTLTSSSVDFSIHSRSPTESRRPSSSPPPLRRSRRKRQVSKGHRNSDVTLMSTEDTDHLRHRGKARPRRTGHEEPYLQYHHEQRQQVVGRHRRAFRELLLAANTHAFAIIDRDGSLQYAYCRPLSAVHSLVILTTTSYSSVYVTAAERTAARYALLVDHALGLTVQKSPQQRFIRRSYSTSSTASVSEAPNPSTTIASVFNVLRCPPHVASELCRTTLSCLGTHPSHSLPNLPLHTLDVPEMDVGTASHSAPASALPPDPHAMSSRQESRSPPTHISLPRNSSQQSDSMAALVSGSPQVPLVDPVGNGRLSDVLLERDDARPTWQDAEPLAHSSDLPPAPSAAPVPWDLPAEASISAERVIELADATLLFRYLPVRSIIATLVALMEERHVCIIGPDTALVSRAVLAMENLLRPFEWPHPISPIVLENMIDLLGAPMPYLYGLLDMHVPDPRVLPDDGVVFVDLNTGKINAPPEVGDLVRRVPRRVRSKLERRLTRTKTACVRQVYRSRSSLSLSNTATTFVRDGDMRSGVDGNSGEAKRGTSLLWRSRSQSKLENPSSRSVNVWLDYDTIVLLDKAMRKFFAELLEEVALNRTEGFSGVGAGFPPGSGEAVGKMASGTGGGFGTSKRDSDRRQLVKAFCETQAFMQWEKNGKCDFTFGLPATNESLLRKRGGYREISSLGQKKDDEPATTPGESETVNGRRTKGYIRVMSDLDEDMLSGEDGVLSPGEEVGGRRKRMRRRRKYKLRTRMATHGEMDDVEGHEVRDVLSDMETPEPRVRAARMRVAREIEMGRERTESTECVADWDGEGEGGEGAKRRAWLKMRLPTTPWNGGKDAVGMGHVSGGREEETGEDGSDDETDEFGDAGGEHSAERMRGGGNEDEDVFPVDDNGVGWNRVRPWGRRRMRMSVRT